MAFRHELRLALRILNRGRSYAFAVIALIGLAVTAGSVLFTVYKGALLDPWPYEGGERLLVFRGHYPSIGREEYPLWSARDYAEIAGLGAVFDHVIAGRGRDVNLAHEEGAERVRGAELTPNAFAMLGIRPLHGRLLIEADAETAAAPTVLIGHGLWQRRYGGDPGAVGETLPVDGVQHTIVGVMPPRFLWWGSELWLPIQLNPVGAGRDDRRREFAVRAALGASPARMTRSLLAENGVLAALGALVGLAGAAMCTDLVLALIPYGYFPAEANVALDARVAAFAAALALLVAFLAVLPAAASMRQLRLAGALHEARGTGTRSAVRLRSAFVVAQLALATVVVAAALAVGGNFRGKLAADPGFITEQAMSMRVSLPRDAYPDRPALRRFALALEERLSAMSGIDAAGIGLAAPLAAGAEHPVSIRMGAASAELSSRYEIVAGDWFDALGVSTVTGRVFDDADGEDSLRVAVVNQTFARSYLSGRDPLGQLVRAGPGGDEREWLTIVGVVEDTHVGGVDAEVRPLVYQPVAQSEVQLRNAVVLVRGTATPPAMVESVRRGVAALDPSVPVHDVASFERLVLDSMGGQRLAAYLLGGFGVAVLLLAALGVYGIVSYVTHLARGEFGLRMAVGATGPDIARLVGQRSLLLAAIGIGIGVLLSGLALRLIAGLLAQPLPPMVPVLTISAALLLSILVTGCAGPAVSSARTDPCKALRDE